MKKRLLSTLAGSLTLMLSASSFAGHHDSDGKEVIMNNLETGMSMGSVMVSSYDDDGVVFTPNLSGLTSGIHGFHVHQNGDCSPAVTDGKKCWAAQRAAISIQKIPVNTVLLGLKRVTRAIYPCFMLMKMETQPSLSLHQSLS